MRTFIRNHLTTTPNICQPVAPEACRAGCLSSQVRQKSHPDRPRYPRAQNQHAGSGCTGGTSRRLPKQPSPAKISPSLPALSSGAEQTHWFRLHRRHVTNFSIPQAGAFQQKELSRFGQKTPAGTSRSRGAFTLSRYVAGPSEFSCSSSRSSSRVVRSSSRRRRRTSRFTFISQPLFAKDR